MAKTGGVLPTILRGVSQQPHEVRLDGQHAEQVNMLSDPVHGLVRRQGSVAQAASSLGVSASADIEAKDWVAHDVQIEGDEYALLVRKKASAYGLPPVIVYRKRDNFRMPVNASAGALAQLANGVAAQTVAGRFIVLAGVGRFSIPIPSEPQDVISLFDYERYDSAQNKNRAVVWVKSGAYNTKFRVTIKLENGTTISEEFASRAAVYPEALNLSDIAFDDPEYQKKVNDRTAYYNWLKAIWEREASTEAQAGTVATVLRSKLFSYTSIDVGREGEVFLTIKGETSPLAAVEVWDSSGNNLMQVVYMEVDSEDDLAPYSMPGRTVMVRPKGGTPWYAVAVPSGVAGGLPVYGTAVKWREYSRDYIGLTSALVFGTVVGNTVYLAESTTELQSLSGVETPEFKAGRIVGDEDTSPLPYFAGRAITYLGMFQDRMVIGCGPVLNFSAAGDYFTFCRTTVLTYPDSDPVEAYAVGSGGDNIRHGLVFDKSLLLFGDRAQYMVPGTVPLTPKTVQISESSSYSDTAVVQPVGNGSLVFYGQAVEGSSQLYQIATGAYVDSSISQEVTQQLGNYIDGDWVSFASCTAPDFVVARTTNKPSSLYVYRYLDADNKRVLDSWSRWDYAAQLGPIMGTAFYKGELLLFHMRREGGTLYLCVDKQSMLGKPTLRPLLDSARTGGTGNMGMPTFYSGVTYAFGKLGSSSAPSYLGADSVADFNALLSEFPGWSTASAWAGIPFNSYVTMTNPFPKSFDGRPKTSGRTTISFIKPTLQETGGLTATVAAHETTAAALDFNGRIINTPENMVGGQPLYSGTVNIPVFRETKEYDLTIASKGWLPLAITAIEWTGQHF